MSEIMSGMALGLSLFAFGWTIYSCWYAHRVNRKLIRRNMDLFAEKVELWKKVEEYEAEILRLQNLLKIKEKES
jgi:hypothetical protein